MVTDITSIGLHRKSKGDVSELMVTARLIELGRAVLKPIGDNQRYDLVVEDAGEFKRVQVKTGYTDSQASSCIRFPTCSSANHTVGGKKHDYRGEVDYFAVYYPVTRTVYWVPVNDVGTSVASLRLAPARNGQTVGVRFARDYEL